MLGLTEKDSKDSVALACAELKKLGWFFDYDPANKVWDIETPVGWKVAGNYAELWKAINEPKAESLSVA